jgi:hypothetical protein
VSVRDARIAAVAAAALAVLVLTAMALSALALRRAERARGAAAGAAEELALQRQLLEAFGARLEAFGARLDGFGADAERLGRQVASARRATFPVLRAAWKFGGSPNLPVGTVDYVGGSEPALDVGVLVRWRDRDLFHTTLELVGPLTRSVPFSATGCDAATAARLPVPDDPFKHPDPESAGLVVVWTDPDGARRWWGQRYRFSFGFPEPDGPALSGTATAPGGDAAEVRLTGAAARRPRVRNR